MLPFVVSVSFWIAVVFYNFLFTYRKGFWVGILLKRDRYWWTVFWFPQEHLQHLLFLPPLLLLLLLPLLLLGVNPSLRPSHLPVSTAWAGAPSSAPSSPSTKANWKNQILLIAASHVCEKKKKKMLIFVLVQFVHSKSFSNLRLAVKSDCLYLDFFDVCFIHI